MQMQENRTHRVHQSGFTLIELVIVLVILGVLAAVAVPQMGNLTSSADTTARNSQAAALNSANTMNVAQCRLNSGSTDCEGSITDCSGATDLVDNFDSDKYSISSGSSGDNSFELTTNAGGSSEANTTCVVTLD